MIIDILKQSKKQIYDHYLDYVSSKSTVFEEDNNQVVVVTLDAYSDWELHKNLSSYGFEKIRLRRSNQVSKYLTKKISIALRKENDE